MRSQSSSVFGECSTVLFLSMMTLTESKMLSAIGSSMSRISSLTETTGFMSPQSGVVVAVAGTETAVVAELAFDEQAPAQAKRKRAVAAMITREAVFTREMICRGARAMDKENVNVSTRRCTTRRAFAALRDCGRGMRCRRRR
jgi:hypothetical protein